ncbi:hypothetical protein [Streptomyces sp. NPDC059008]|uniref:hypothetical protein n=1 Tax=Streptomyces sp. NPDC059008 TaxID=3346693 RepID=UPI0036CD48E3
MSFYDRRAFDCAPSNPEIRVADEDKLDPSHHGESFQTVLAARLPRLRKVKVSDQYWILDCVPVAKLTALTQDDTG